MRMEDDAANRTGIIPVLFVPHSKESGFVCLDGFKPSSSISRKRLGHSNQIAKRGLILELTLKVNCHTHD